MNETGNPKDSRAEAVPFPRDPKEFRRWRINHDIQTRELEQRAILVENDLRLLLELDPVVNTNTIAVCERHIQDFAENLRARG